MRYAQGKPRKMPDGFLHLNNFSHIRASGLAGFLYERLMTTEQQRIVLNALVERAGDAHGAYKFEHDAWRFSKEFLLEHFKKVVYGTYWLVRKSAAQEVSVAITREMNACGFIKVDKVPFGSDI